MKHLSGLDAIFLHSGELVPDLPVLLDAIIDEMDSLVAAAAS